MNRYDHYTDKFIADPHDTQYGILGTNLAELGTDLVSKQEVLDLWNKYHSYIATKAIEFDSELRALPSAEPQEHVMLDKEKILQAGYKNERVEFYIGGRKFVVKELAQ